MDIGYVYYIIGILLGFTFFLLLRKEKMLKRIASGLLLSYCFLLVVTAVLSRKAGVTRRFQPELFWTYRTIIEGGSRKSWMWAEIILNIFMLLPAGVLIPAVVEKNKLRWTIIFGFAFSVFIELLQYFTGRGLFELDDILHNSVGVMLGFGIYKILERFVCRRKKNADGRSIQHPEPDT